jgi:Family of unknown function (DUF6166)
MKTYTGQRTELGAVVLVRQEQVRTKVLRLRTDLRNHSPTGFEWGYGGSGPAQLALALCADATGDDARALKVYQRFKWRCISGIKGDKWQMSQDEILAAVEAIENERSDPPRSV